ncbi:MAG: putative colanic acid biosynthesis acetyltransferase [Croceibacterium sp.]
MRSAYSPAANKLERALWAVTWLLLARFTPPQFYPWRGWLLRLFGAKVGARAKVYSSVRIWLPRNLDLGAFACASTHSMSAPTFPLSIRPVTVGRGCWVAAEAFVGPGLTIADGAVLGARGALFEDAKAMGVYRGNPAAYLRQRRFADPAGDAQS